MLTVLDQFSEERFAWTVEEIAAELDYTASSAYRYVRELCRAGLLSRLPGGTYVVGAKVIELEALIRRVDPVARAAGPVLRGLAEQTGCGCLLSSVYGDHLINIAHERGVEPIELTYVRGRPLPWFRGAPGKAVLAFMASTRARKLFEKFGDPGEDADAAWRACRAQLKRIRQAGYCISFGELDPHAVGLDDLTVCAADRAHRVLDEVPQRLVPALGRFPSVEPRFSTKVTRLEELGEGVRVEMIGPGEAGDEHGARLYRT